MTRRLLIAALLVLAPQLAQAFPITWALTGTMSNGDPFVGTLAFDLDAAVFPGTFFTDERSLYYRALTAMSFDVGGDLFTLNLSQPHNDFDVRYAMTPPNPVGDALLVFADVLSPDYVDALSLSLFLRFFDPTETWLADGGPPPIPNLSTLSQREFVVRYQDPNGQVIDSFGEVQTLRAVPEPSTLLLLSGGIAALIRRRQFSSSR